MRIACVTLPFLLILSVSAQQPSNHSYLFLWSGDRAHKASDFLAVIDSDPDSADYGKVITSIPTGEAGTHPHHTEAEMPSNGHLLANGFHAGRTWLFDLTDPRQPHIVTSFTNAGRYTHPHTYIRLADNRVLAAFQYSGNNRTGGLVEMDERGRIYRSGSAADSKIADKEIFPYSVVAIPALNRAVSTTTNMNGDVNKLSSQWVQVWDFAKLKLLYSVAMPPGPLGREHAFTGEPRLLPDGRSVYIHTFNCGLYLLRDLDRPRLTAKFVKGFEGKVCGVPILTGNYWLQTVSDAHTLVSLDISDPEHPREVSRVNLGADEEPHWIAIDPTGKRIVLNSGGDGTGNRLFVINFDPATGKLSMDERFRVAGDERPGIALNGKAWPHGFQGDIVPHGTVFSK
jgi:hypothetical protein